MIWKKTACLDKEITHHTDKSLSPKVYRKPTHIHKHLPFQSHHPLAHKVSVVWMLYQRADHLCTFADSKTEEEQHMSERSWHGYPDQVLTLLHPMHQQQANTLPKATVVILYVNRMHVWGNQKSASSTWHPDLFQTTQNIQESPDSSKRPCSTRGEGRRGVQGPLWWLPFHICRADGKDFDAPCQLGTQMGPDNSQLHGLCPCWTCYGRWPITLIGQMPKLSMPTPSSNSNAPWRVKRFWLLQPYFSYLTVAVLLEPPQTCSAPPPGTTLGRYKISVINVLVGHARATWKERWRGNWLRLH